MDDFLIGPQSDEYTWWDYEMELVAELDAEYAASLND